MGYLILQTIDQLSELNAVILKPPLSTLQSSICIQVGLGSQDDQFVQLLVSCLMVFAVFIHFGLNQVYPVFDTLYLHLHIALPIYRFALLIATLEQLLVDYTHSVEDIDS